MSNSEAICAATPHAAALTNGAALTDKIIAAAHTDQMQSLAGHGGGRDKVSD